MKNNEMMEISKAFEEGKREVKRKRSQKKEKKYVEKRR